MNFKLYDRLPEGVTVGKRFFKCNFDFRNVLKMLDLMQRDDLEFSARDYHCARCVYPHRMTLKTARALYGELCNVLFEKPPENAAESGKKLSSFEQDAPLIRAAFRQVYGINLFTDDLSWFEFIELFQGLPDGNRFEDVVGIRAKPLPAPNKYNAKERQALMEAKRKVAIHLTEREQEKKYQQDIGRIFSGLMSMIPKEVNTDGE